jgi:hypothetical protein
VDRILIAGIGCVTAKYLPAALREAGLEPVFLLDLDNYVGEPREVLAGCEWYHADLNNPEPVLDLLLDKPEILAGVVAVSGFFDDLFPLVERIAVAHDLAYVGPVAARLADKAEVVRLIPEYSPRTVTFGVDGVPIERLRELGDELVLKPGVGTAGFGIVRLPTAGLDAGTVRDAITASGLPDAAEQTWLAQASIDGELISLEGYVEDGALHVTGFSLRGRIGWTEVDNLYPADAEIDAGVRSRCVQAVRALAARAGYRDGYLHCEFLVGADRPYLIDANVGRLGGGTTVEEHALAHGLSSAEIVRHVLLLPLGIPTTTPAYKPVEQTVQTLSYAYGLAEGGWVRSIRLPADSGCLHTWMTRTDRPVPPLGTSDFAWVGVLVGTTAAARDTITRIRIETDTGLAPACYTPAS